MGGHAHVQGERQSQAVAANSARPPPVAIATRSPKGPPAHRPPARRVGGPLSAPAVSFGGVDELTTTTGIVALAAAAVALAAVAAVVVLARRLGRMRADQRALLGEHDREDLIAHAAALRKDFASLSASVEDVAMRLESRLSEVEARLDGAVAYRGLVRYDAYNEMSGRQSTSIALLDARRSGIVVSSIHHRDQARFYAKQVIEGRSQIELSPEEQEAVRVALAGEVADGAEQR